VLTITVVVEWWLRERVSQTRRGGDWTLDTGVAEGDTPSCGDRRKEIGWSCSLWSGGDEDLGNLMILNGEFQAGEGTPRCAMFDEKRGKKSNLPIAIKVP